MAIASETATKASQASLQELAKRHLWMHFTRMAPTSDARSRSSPAARAATSTTSTASATSTGSRRLFCVNAGHGRTEIGEAMARQVGELDFFTVWSYAHPRAIELAARIASLTPADLNRVFFTSGGSEAVESALKLARNYHRAQGNGPEDQGDRPRDRLPRHLAGRAVGDRDHRPALAVRAAHPGRRPRPQHRQLPLAGRPRPALGRRPDRGADPLRGARDGRRGDPRAGAERRRLHPAAGGLLPARARDLRPPRRAADLRRGDLLLGPARAPGSAASATATGPT